MLHAIAVHAKVCFEEKNNNDLLAEIVQIDEKIQTFQVPFSDYRFDLCVSRKERVSHFEEMIKERYNNGVYQGLYFFFFTSIMGKDLLVATRTVVHFIISFIFGNFYFYFYFHFGIYLFFKRSIFLFVFISVSFFRTSVNRKNYKIVLTMVLVFVLLMFFIGTNCFKKNLVIHNKMS